MVKSKEEAAKKGKDSEGKVLKDGKVEDFTKAKIDVPVSKKTDSGPSVTIKIDVDIANGPAPAFAKKTSAENKIMKDGEKANEEEKDKLRAGKISKSSDKQIKNSDDDKEDTKKGKDKKPETAKPEIKKDGKESEGDRKKKEFAKR